MKTMINKVIFLDIDGVLNVYCEGRDEYGCTFHKHFEDNLSWIIKQTKAKIVISSTWRFSGLEILKEMWDKRGLPGEVIDITPDSNNLKRGDEIQHWLDNNKVINYVIVDDDNDMLDIQKNNFVQTSGNYDHSDCVDVGYGLTRKCSERIVKILNKQ
jgi:hypothetical protein